MSNDGGGMIKQIIVGVAIAVLTAVILIRLGIKEAPSPPPPYGNRTPDEKSDNRSPQPVSSQLTPQPSASVTSKPTPPESFAPQQALPSNTCPVMQGMVWMQSPDMWYGPFTGGDGISFGSNGGFWVYNATMLNVYGTYGAVIPYPDPYRQIQRNAWIPLQQSRFSVCVDGSGNVFALHN